MAGGDVCVADAFDAGLAVRLQRTGQPPRHTDVVSRIGRVCGDESYILGHVIGAGLYIEHRGSKFPLSALGSSFLLALLIIIFAVPRARSYLVIL